VKNFYAVTILSLGLPMILMGDEVRRSQCGNNNAYCQDNEISWFDWTLAAKHCDVHRFVRLLNEHRVTQKPNPLIPARTLNDLLRESDRSWHGVKLGQPDWSNDSHSLAYSAARQGDNLMCYAIFNAYWKPLEFELPPLTEGKSWHRWIDTIWNLLMILSTGMQRHPLRILLTLRGRTPL
jgi:glycogen operon protein